MFSDVEFDGFFYIEFVGGLFCCGVRSPQVVESRSSRGRITTVTTSELLTRALEHLPFTEISLFKQTE